MSALFPGFPDRAMLRPGIRVCRREDGWLQVGLDERLALVAPDTAHHRAVLEALHHGTGADLPRPLPAPVASFCRDLLDHDLVVDGDALLSALGAAGTDAQREAVAAHYGSTGHDAEGVLAGRAEVGVVVQHAGLPEAADRCRALLERSGLLEDPDGLVVHLSRGEPDRESLDTWMREDVPHLLVATVEGTVRIGPFVVPGVTACLRCVDAHHAERDPRRSLVVAQYSPLTDCHPAVPDPVHHDLLDLAVVWAARDVASWADGRRPRTWSTTVAVDPALDLPEEAWRPHPACGCGWTQYDDQVG